ncbi:MAG: prephenate dehydrogenase/arogenate dehydrogenase family protein [Bacteroidaceae bacterium]|nr:prephenate dehydrogenase/arogenate dehydrogenase family protein [Prevotellaceae bacterium]MDY5632287.1 prephenate dehydrogenase/arogenate dehydrogenase family protein [Bacteroidaceae bacterium]
MKILILGAGKMGSFFTDLLSFDHECAVYEIDARRMRFLYNTQRFTTLEEIANFQPDMVINCVTLKYTIEVFRQVVPLLPHYCIISDISSVKNGFKEYYDSTGMPYVSTHPMFGPTFANLGALSSENAIVINEGDYLGRVFFLDLYRRLGLNVHEYSFEEHDEAMAYSLSVPFVSTFVFSAVMKHQDAPGTTFKRHLGIAKGVLSEDDTLLREILFNPRTKNHVENIRKELKNLIGIIDDHDEEAFMQYMTKIRNNIK